MGAKIFAGLYAIVLLLAISPAAIARDFDQGLLWKIESPGSKASYLFGTIHVEDPRVTTLAAPVERAFENADSVTLEITMDPMSLISLSLSMMMTDGRDLRSIVGDVLYHRSIEAISGYGLPEMAVAQMKPWAVATMLVTPKPKTGAVLDTILYQRATNKGKPVHGLETAEEQMQVFDGMSEKLQVTMLKDTLDHLPEIKQQLDDLLAAYLARDLAEMVELYKVSMKMSDQEVAENFNRRGLVERNHRMAERMQSRIKEGNAFIAVGALHLPGEEGLLNLLDKKGYGLTRVY